MDIGQLYNHMVLVNQLHKKLNQLQEEVKSIKETVDKLSEENKQTTNREDSNGKEL